MRATLVSGPDLAASQASAAAQVGPLPADVLAVVLDKARAADVAPVEWLTRAIRAHAQAPATAAERQRAYRARKAQQPKEM